MGTGICLFLHWENRIWVTALGLRITNTKLGMGNMSRNYPAYVINAQGNLKLIERLKKYTFDLQKGINETSALHRAIRLASRRFFSDFASQLCSCTVVTSCD